MILNTLLDTATHKVQVYKPDPVAEKKAIERQWRDSELLRTDEFVKLPDHPDNLIAYRALLRDYPASINYPNGDRPAI